MKKRLIYLLLLLVLSSGLSTSSVAQESCNDYFLLTNNAQYEILTYDSRNKLTARSTYHVKNVTTNNGKMQATIETKAYDKKDKPASEGEFTIECDEGAISMDMTSMVSPGMVEAYKSMDVTMTGDKMFYPKNLRSGQKLDDGKLVIEVKDKSNGQVMSTITMRIMDRTVEGEESIVVPAGTFNSYKISQNTEMENRTMGMKMPGMKMQTIEYFVPDMGMVRTESFRNGKLISYSVLSKVSK